MNFPIIDVYTHPHYGDSVRYENYVELQEVAEKLEARVARLEEALKEISALYWTDYPAPEEMREIARRALEEK